MRDNYNVKRHMNHNMNHNTRDDSLAVNKVTVKERISDATTSKENYK